MPKYEFCNFLLICLVLFDALQMQGDSDKDSDSSSSKKQRVIWSAEMHQQFVAAVNQLGIDSEP